MVAQYLANVTFVSTNSRIRRTCCEANVPVVASLMVPLVTPVNSANEATSHDWSFDLWRVNQELAEVLKKRHVCELSRISENQVASENQRHPPDCPGWIQVPTMVGARRRRQGSQKILILSRLPQSMF